MLDNKRSSLELYHLKQRIRELEKKESAVSSTTLITLYIPAKTQLSDISAKLKSELGTSVNIKDRKTGKAVTEAIRSIISRMQYLKNGKNGLAIFAGTTADTGKTEYYAIEPPEPVTIKDYVCDTRFHVEHLKSMLEQRDQLGVVVIDRGGATFATIRGSHMNIISNNASFVPGKHSRGGQSAGRIERGIELLAQEFYSKMAHKANTIYLEQHPITALVIGGPAMSKDQFIDHPTLDYRLREKIFKVYDVGYTGEAGIRELLVRAGDDLADYAMVRERKLVQQFLEEIGLDSGKAIYGEQFVKGAFEQAAVDILLFSEGIEKIHAKIQCSNCKKAFLESTTPINLEELKVKVNGTACPKCSKYTLSVVSKQYLIEEFERLSMDTGASIEIISLGHEDGKIFYDTFTGIGAILRYKIDL